jgi:hypothetical protein
MYPICPESRGLLDELDHLRSAARALLGLASPAACEEWTKFERRLPSALELLRGAISLSRSELREMGSKARRFRDILEASRGGSPGDGVSRALIGRP